MLRLSLRQNVIVGYLSALIVCFVGWLAYESAQQSVDASAAVQLTRSASQAARAIGASVRDAESTQRGFLLTDDPRYLTSYRNAVDSARAALVSLRATTTLRPKLAARVDSLGYFIGLELAELDQTLRLQRDMGRRAAVDVVRSERGAESMQQIARLLRSVDTAADRTLGASHPRALSNQRTVLLIVAGAVTLGVLLAILVNIFHIRNVREQRRITDELEEQSTQLHMQAVELQAANTELENATRELVAQTVETERSGMRLAGILGSATDAVVSFDDDQRIVYFNAAAERLLGVDGEPLAGSEVSRFIAQRSVQSFEERMIAARRAAQSGTPSPELWDTVIGRGDGEEIPVEVSMAYARTGRQGLFTAVLRDVTRQRQLEEEFRQAQKMEAVGRLAGGIAHDFNNLLTVIGASSDFLLYDLKDDSRELARDITEIKLATDRAASLTRQLLAFSRRQLIQPQLLDLNLVVAEMETMLRRLIGEDVVLSTSYVDHAGLVRLDRGQLEQIVVNLVVNARDAMVGGGVVHLRTGLEHDPSRDRGTPREGIAGEYVTLSVSDTGVGMDEATRSRIFEPFFTTKEQGKGTGLGLSTVYGIVKQAAGDIEVTSELEAGTEFKLFFPAMGEEQAGAPAPATVPPDTLRGNETILVVEDEEPLRRLTRRILESRGYRVLDAADGEAAIRLMATTPGRIDLLLTDVVMPRMSGRELAERLLPVYPWLRVLFMSGYTEDTILQHRISELGITVLEKPFSRDDLATAVRSTLDRC